MKHIHLIVGARPNFMKIAPLCRELKQHPDCFTVRLIHTGQHYDEKMSHIFFQELGLPKPDEYLEVGSGRHGEQTARVMQRYEESLLRDRPDLVVVAGDVNSTMACALDAVKLHIPVAHLEAGLRSFDRSMPEEINRIVTDSVSQWLLTPSRDGDEHLLQEGVAKERIHFVGNIMIDSLQQHKSRAVQSRILETLGVKPSEFLLITLHRPSNVDTREGLDMILTAFAGLSHKLQLVFPIHPRTRKRITEFDMEDRVNAISGLKLIDPIGYHDFLKLQMTARLVLTDSGGVQEETTCFGTPCLTLRPNTERPVTITQGTNQLVPLNSEAIIGTALDIIDHGLKKEHRVPDLWDGKTAGRIVRLWLDHYDELGVFQP